MYSVVSGTVEPKIVIFLISADYHAFPHTITAARTTEQAAKYSVEKVLFARVMLSTNTIYI